MSVERYWYRNRVADLQPLLRYGACLGWPDRDLTVTRLSSTGGQHLTREVVLLTDDRNLRLKALSMDVPTRTVPDFVAWAS